MQAFSLHGLDHERLQPIAARISLVLLLLLVMWLAVRWLLLLLSGPEIMVRMPDLPRPAAQQGFFAASNGKAAANNIADLHLFGAAGVSNPLQLEMLPETPLDLQLRGIVAASDEDQQGHAIIISSDGREWVYGVGDRLSDDTEVIAITAQQVVLQRNGKRETLSLPRLAADQTAPGVRSSLPVRQQQARARTQGNNALVGNAMPGLAAIRGGMPSITASSAGSIAGVSLDSSNLARMAQMIQVTPAAGGGYQVFPGRDASQFKQFGLQANDVVTAVNGQPLTNVQAALQIFQNLPQQNSVTLTVRRDGQVLQLQPDVSALQQP
jgi:general secretion pathway protein C